MNPPNSTTTTNPAVTPAGIDRPDIHVEPPTTPPAGPAPPTFDETLIDLADSGSAQAPPAPTDAGGAGFSIVIPAADDDEPTLIHMPSVDDATTTDDAAATGVASTYRLHGAEGADPGEPLTDEMIDWFLDPDVAPPSANRDVGERHVVQRRGDPAESNESATTPSLAFSTDTRPLPQRFDRPPLPEDLLLLKARAQSELAAHVSEQMGRGHLSEDELQTMVIEVLGDFMQQQNTEGWTESQLDQLAEELLADILGHGPIQSLLDDPTVSEVMVNGSRSVFVERAGQIQKTGVTFTDDEHVMRIIDLIVSRVGRRVDESSPMVDARLPDGSRVNAIIPPLSVDGPMLTIRKFSKNAMTTQDMVAYQTLSWDSVALLRAAVYGRLNVVISGGTGTGKTTLLNVCSGFIPESERVVTIEDSVELRLNQEHVIRLESRPPNIEGSGAVPIRQLVRNSLRMRPDRIVVGECRGAEALDMLQAMNTGHEGSLTTLHANSPRDAIARLETMVLMAGMDLPIRAIREQVASAIDMIVHLDRLRDGSRRVTKISEVVGMEGDTITTSDIFAFDAKGIDELGRYEGGLAPTGIRPAWTEKLALQGIELRASTFGDVSLDTLR